MTTPSNGNGVGIDSAQRPPNCLCASEPKRSQLVKEDSKVRKIAFVGDHLPRKCGIATFTSDLMAAVAAAHPQSECFCVSVNDLKGGYEYPECVRFEIDEQDLSSYLRAADFLNINNVDIVCLQHEFGIFGGVAGGHILASCAN
jgi:hypothetical protein